MQASTEPTAAPSYNDRLFSGGLRSYFHFARFHWIADEIKRLNLPCESVLELGCFDGRLIEYLPTRPRRYVGADANWEDGLDLARAKYGSVPGYAFVEATKPAHMDGVHGKFDLGASLETLEHVPPELVDGYLKVLADRVSHLLVTVPVELGPVFFVKWAVKKVLRMSPARYRAREVFWALIGRSDLVERAQHKGFDYRQLVRHLEQHFDVVHVQGFPMRWLPTWLCFGAGISATRKGAGAHAAAKAPTVAEGAQAVRTQKYTEI